MIHNLSVRAATQAGGALVVLMLVVSAGCGGNRAMPTASSKEVAKQSLEKALAKWAAGQPPESLATENPKIYVNDVDWKDGRKLKQFQLAGPAEEVGLQVRLPVTLDVEDASGQVVKNQVSYSVSTSPVVSIVRDDP